MSASFERILRTSPVTPVVGLDRLEQRLRPVAAQPARGGAPLEARAAAALPH